jgi:hypothetical protein
VDGGYFTKIKSWWYLMFCGSSAALGLWGVKISELKLVFRVETSGLMHKPEAGTASVVCGNLGRVFSLMPNLEYLNDDECLKTAVHRK